MELPLHSGVVARARDAGKANSYQSLAQQRLEIDLDDGVKGNYLKFAGAVQPIPGLAAKED